MTGLGKKIARHIIERVGGPGEPPEYGLQYFSSGLDQYLQTIDGEYLDDFVKDGGSAFKMVVGVYGGGKTHFLYAVRDLAWKNNYVASYVVLKSGESPFHKLELVYKAIVRGLFPPLSPEELLSGYEKGIVAFLKRWYAELYQKCLAKGLGGSELKQELERELEQLDVLESISFSNAVKNAFKALMEDNESDFLQICQWLSGEGYDSKVHKRFNIVEKLDRTTAFKMIRSLGQWLRQVGYSGLVVLLDEAEQEMSLSTRDKQHHLSNLREIIDETGHASFQGFMFFYAVPDENFLEGRTQIYEALRQRVGTVFDDINPTGVKIDLEGLAIEGEQLLQEIGRKLTAVYLKAYEVELDKASVDRVITMSAESALEERYADIGYKRLFVQRLIRGLNYLRAKETAPTLEVLRGT